MDFTYPCLERIDGDLGRVYLTPDGPAPSVTTVLGSTSDQTWLREWEERIGKAEADRQTEEAATICGAMHAAIESHLLGTPPPSPETELDALGTRMGKTIVATAIRKLTRVWGVEVGLHLSDLYAGTADLVGLWNRVPSVIDYKSVRWVRSQEKNLSSFEQCAAYAMAHDAMFGTEIRRLVIVECNRRLDVRIHIAEGADFDRARDGWLRRLDEFWS